MKSSLNPECIELKNVCLDYGNVKVLQEVHLTVLKGEIRAMVGEHGAGKSTIAKTLGGLLVPDSGEIMVMGKRQSARSGPFPGVAVVHQTVRLMANLSVSENMFINDTVHFKSPFFRKKKIHEFTNTFLAGYGSDLRGEYLVSDLKRSDWVLIDILRKIFTKPDLLILDEAIEQLSNESVLIVLDVLRKEVERGMSVIYITHRIDDVYTFADTVSIVKNGKICFTDTIENIDKINLIKIAYTQLSGSSSLDQYNEEFFHLLKYNEAILRNLPVSLIVVNRNEEIKIINDSAIKLLDLQKSTGDENLESIFNKSPEIISMIKASFQKEKIQQFYYLPFKRPDSREILINISKVPIFDEHFLIGNILLLDDITEQENLREEFELREKLVATGLLAAGVAHEINNPLGMVLNDLHFIKMISRDDRVHASVQNLEKHFGFITDVVSNLLSFSDQKMIDGGTIEINSTITEMIHLLGLYVKTKNVELKFETTEEKMYVNISANELKQILLNLIKNSIEAFPGGGCISMRTDRIETDADESIQIIIVDDGPGISQERINDIFLPFNSTKKNSGRNSGLGLSVSYTIVKKYKGTIRVDTYEGKGCRFTLMFPASDVEA